MKKYLVWIGVAVLVGAMASSSMAQTPQSPFTSVSQAWKSWGFLEIATGCVYRPDMNQGTTNSNIPMTFRTSTGTAASTAGNVTTTSVQPGSDANLRQIAERFRYWLQWGDPKTARGVIGFEADSTNWGESATTPSETTVSNPSGRIGVYKTDQVMVEIKHVFIDFVIPQTPVSVTAGLQGYYIGGRLFMSNDAPGLMVTADFSPHKITAYWWRERDVDTLKYNVNDTYGVQYQLSQKLFNVYAYYLYKNDLTGGGTQTASASATFQDHPWWFGIGGGFTPGNWDFKGQFIYNGGKRDFVSSATSDKDYEAWVAELSAKYRIGPGLAATVEGFWSTGNDTKKTDKITEFTTPSLTEATYGFGNDRSVFYYFNSDFMYYWGQQLYYQGTWYARANVEYNPIPRLNLNFNYLYIGDTAQGTPRTASGNGSTAVNINSLGSTRLQGRTDADKNYVGSELNVIARIKIYDTLGYNIGFGYFFPGDVFDTPARNADTAWALLTRLRFIF